MRDWLRRPAHVDRSSAILALARRQPLMVYFVLAFGISWGAVALISGRAADSTSLMLGLFLAQAAGHIGPDVPGSAAGWGDLWPWRVLFWMYAGMVPYRVLMTWVYRHTGSMLLAILMHATYSGGQVLLEPGTTTLTESLVWWGLLGLALTALVGVITFADRAHMLERSACSNSDMPQRQHRRTKRQILRANALLARR